MAEPALIMVAGLAGAVGSTLAAGLSMPPEEIAGFGVATESPLVRASGCRLLPFSSMSIHGWDMNQDTLYASCKRHRICPPEVLSKAKQRLQRIKPRKGIELQRESIGDWIRREAAHLNRKRRREDWRHVILVNLCPTEPVPKQDADERIDWRNLDELELGASYSVSQIYFRLAIEARAHFINFTPNPAEITPLRELAEEKGLIYAGRDGKTGQTFIKTTLAPAFRDKNLRIDGWFSTNLLGNDDGLSLSKPGAGETKIISKSKCLSSILGYVPGGAHGTGHQVHIHYYPPRGDSKEAWDNIDFRGFLGVPMQLKINWLGQDSILAAPAIIDLVRVVAYAAEAGCHGSLDAASYFFKDPIVGEGASCEHSVPEQFRKLIEFLTLQR
ncbi:MAG: inositol-3-phosphate synthase [Acidobacteriota bacterium]